MTDFQISRRWLPTKDTSELDVTMAELKLTVGDKNVTEFVEDDGEKSDHLEIPMYFLAEWTAENWWPLLWEPRKSEEGPDSAEFLARHSILTAQHGFALPRVSFVPTGKTINISAKAREASYADVRFRRSAQASPLRADVESELRTFVEAVCKKLNDSHISDTGLQCAWQLVEDVTEDEVQFCEFVGALGLSPNEVSDHTADLLQALLSKFGKRLLMDLCLVSKPESFDAIAGAAGVAFDGINKAPATTLEPLLAISVSTDNFTNEAWQRGVRAARQLRSRFGIKDIDPTGATQIFERLKIDTTVHCGDSSGVEGSTLYGAVARDDNEARIALLQPILVQRRFAAARAIFTAWTSERQESRFLTSAVTRDQQASRAFAAELTAPYSLLRARSRQSRLTQDEVFDLAAELQIGSDVVSKQALNNGLQVRPI
jgi:hypothetical protein